MNNQELDVCQWPKCNLPAVTQVYWQVESMFCCRAHRNAAVVNIESKGKLWISENPDKLIDARKARPGDQKPQRINSPAASAPSAVPTTEERDRTAIMAADAAAIPVDAQNDLIKPQKRDEAGNLSSRLQSGHIRPGEGK